MISGSNTSKHPSKLQTATPILASNPFRNQMLSLFIIMSECNTQIGLVNKAFIHGLVKILEAQSAAPSCNIQTYTTAQRCYLFSVTKLGSRTYHFRATELKLHVRLFDTSAVHAADFVRSNSGLKVFRLALPNLTDVRKIGL